MPPLTPTTGIPYGKTSSTIWGPMSVAPLDDNTDDTIEVSVHTLPKPLSREFHHVFPEDNLNLTENPACEYLVLPTNQRARQDLVATGDHIEQEKDRLLNVFMTFAREVCQKIRDAGYWADYIDPCSGLPMMTLHCNKVYSEVDGMECCLGYKAHNAGFCKVLTHPAWGSAVYPASMFCYAPRDQIVRLMESYPVSKDSL